MKCCAPQGRPWYVGKSTRQSKLDIFSGYVRTIGFYIALYIFYTYDTCVGVRTTYKKNILNSIARVDVKRYEFALHEYCSCVARMQEGE